MDSKSKMFRESHPDTVYDQYLYLHETKEERAERGENYNKHSAPIRPEGRTSIRVACDRIEVC